MLTCGNLPTHNTIYGRIYTLTWQFDDITLYQGRYSCSILSLIWLSIIIKTPMSYLFNSRKTWNLLLRLGLQINLKWICSWNHWHHHNETHFLNITVLLQVVFDLSQLLPGKFCFSFLLLTAFKVATCKKVPVTILQFFLVFISVF